ncbi:MAG: translocation/assembly module TamB domain-containing protein [Blastocatellia bacterium]|nr:translocation/assembly module TamB domain-containing protein [Blastocatellia bacterium]
MPVEEIEKTEPAEEPQPERQKPEKELDIIRRARIFTRRNTLLVAGSGAVLLVLLAFFTVVFYRYGVFDQYIKRQFTARMADMGIDFTPDVFRVTINPLKLELRNATFNDRLTGDRLFFIREADLYLTIEDLWAWQLSRDISINTTEINGAEAWVIFDQDGRSNFANVQLIDEEEAGRVSFKFGSMRFTLRDAVVHFNDASRRIEADANNIQLSIDPIDTTVPDEEKRYNVNLTTTESRFVYDGNALEQIAIRAGGIADRFGAEITEIRIDTPVGYTAMNGTLTDWAELRYDLAVESSVDLTQTSNIFPLGATLRGVGNFRGRVSGSGETYRVDGRIESDTLSADGIYLRGVNIAATVAGTNRNYEANGTAVAELLTFDDFRIEFPRIAGNVRGTGTDFRWVGELQAAAASTPGMSLGGLFLSDAVAEYKDRQLTANAGNARAARFSAGDNAFTDVAMRNVRISSRNGTFELNAPGLQAGSMTAGDTQLRALSGNNLRVRSSGDRTDVNLDALRADSANVGGTRAGDIRADSFEMADRAATTDITLRNLRVGRIDANGTRVDGIQSDVLTLNDRGPETIVYSSATRIARLEAGGAVLGSLNIAGVRLTIREGRVTGRSEDIDAGTVTLAASDTLGEGGTLENVAIRQPVFVLEPSGRYRASADMSLGGGVVGSIPLGAASASVSINNDRAELTNLTAEVMDGRLDGNVALAFTERAQSTVNATFTGLDLSTLIALQAGRVIPFEGQTTGRVDLTFAGTNFRTSTGTINAEISASAGDASQGQIPVNGRIDLSAVNGLFTVEEANLQTPSSRLEASGQLDLRTDDSNLTFALRSEEASEVDRLIRLLGVAPEVEQQLDSLRIEIAGNLNFEGTLIGNVSDPNIDARASLESLIMNGRSLGALSTDLNVSPLGIELADGRLRPPDGGEAAFALNIPSGGVNNITVNATLTNINAGNLLAAVPIDLPENLRDFQGRTSGTVELSGLPNAAQGSVDIAAQSGTIAGQSFDDLQLRADFAGTRVDLTRAQIRVGEGTLTAGGYLDRASTQFDLDLDGKNVPLPLLLSLVPQTEGLVSISGVGDIVAKATGRYDQPSSYSVTFNGRGRDVVINDNPFGDVAINGVTENQILKAELTAILDGQPQLVSATVNFGNADLPFRVQHVLDRSPLRPFFALIPQLRGISISGTGTGRVEFGGNLSAVDAEGNRAFSTEGLTGTAQFSELSLMIQDTPLIATEPVMIRLSTNEIVFESARFAGGGSNLTIAGTKALTDDAMNDLAIDGRVNLALLNVIPGVSAGDIFLSGFSDVSVRLTGVNRVARLVGTANLDNASVAAFIGSDRLTFDRLRGRILFSQNQVQIEQATGYLGGGQFVASGGILLGDGLTINAYRVALNGTNITVPLPADFTTTGDAVLTISGQRINNELTTLIAGSLRARRSIYTRDIDLANLVGGRREASLTGGSGSIYAPRFDLTIEGRDALIIRNNLADLTASLSLRLTGTTTNPEVSGRVTANSGTIFFRRDRYVVQRAVIDFPPDTAIDPVISLQAETEIQGYQIFVNLSGPLTDTENLNATVRSSPALPQADVISLIATGNLSATEAGISAFATTGINTAAEILTDSIINNPARRATDRLFGLNVFEIDPIIAGERLDPSARLTVGRQINNNLRVTYATNLSADQNQVIALEYRVSNRLSVVAQYEQRSLSNVTQNRDNFSIEVRFRKRF